MIESILQFYFILPGGSFCFHDNATSNITCYITPFIFPIFLCIFKKESYCVVTTVSYLQFSCPSLSSVLLKVCTTMADLFQLTL